MATFVRVVDAGSLSKAARAMHVSPAAVSRQMSMLETELGAGLLVRTTRRVTVTEEGRRFYAAAERTVRDVEDARLAVRPDRAMAGPLTVSMPTALGLSRLDVSLTALVAKHPGLRVDLRLEDHPVDLVAEGVDVAVRAGLPPPDTTSLVAYPLAESERVVVAAPAYLRRRGEPEALGELTYHDALVHLHAGVGVGVWTLQRAGETTTVDVRGPLRTNALLALRNAAVAGLGLALLPRFLVADDLHRRRLRVVPLGGWQPPSQSIYALVRVDAKARARVVAFLDHARRELDPRRASGRPSA